MFIQRQIIFHGSHFMNFYLEQTDKVQEKLDYVLKIMRAVQNIPKNSSNTLQVQTDCMKIRIELESNIYRVFCCFDKGNIIVLFNGFQKKSQKTPKREIHMALKLKEEYFKTGGNNNG